MKYTNRSFREFEKRLGKSPLQIFYDNFSEDGKTPDKIGILSKLSSFELISTFVYCGLLHEKTSYEQVVDIIPLKKTTELAMLIIEIITAEYGLADKISESDLSDDTKKNLIPDIGIGIAQNLSPIQT